MMIARDAPPPLLTNRVLLPGVLLLMLGVGAVLWLTVVAASRQDRFAEETALRQVRTAFADDRTMLERLVADYGSWQEAYDHLVGSLDPGWAEANLAAGPARQFGIAMTAVIDPAGRTRYAARDGAGDPSLDFTAFAGGADRLLALARRAAGTADRAPPAAASGYLRWQGEIWLVAAAAVSDRGGSGPPVANRDTVLVMARLLSESHLQRIAESFGIDGLDLTAAGADGNDGASEGERGTPAATLALAAPDGSVLGRLLWRAARPGRELLAELLLPVGGALALMIALGALLVHRAQRAIAANARAANEIAQMRDLFYDAIDSLSEGFVLFGADGRLVVCNEHYRSAYPLIADLLVPGTPFETVLRAAATRADIPEARANLDAWVKTRLERHVQNDAPVDRHLSNGRCYRISEHPTRSGGIVKVLMDITELQRHTEEIASTSTLLRTVIDTIEQGISVFAADGTLLAWNAHFLKLLDYPAGFAQVGRPQAEFDAFDRTRGAVRAAILLGPPLLDDPDAVERRRLSAHELPDGRVIEVCETPMPGGGVVATYTEITERLRFEEVLTKLAQAVSGASGDAFFESLVANLSRALEVEVALIGALAGDGALRTLAVSADGRIVDGLAYRLEGGPFADILEHQVCFCRHEARSRFPDDALLAGWAVESFLGKPLLGSDGRVLGVIAVASRRPLDRADTAEALLDIFAARAAAEFERLQTEIALRESEQRYRQLVEHAPYGIVIADGPRIVFANSAAGRLFGFTDAALLIGGSLTERVGGGPGSGTDAALPAALDAAAAGGAPADPAGGGPIGARLRTAQGEERDIEIGVCPFVAEGRPLALVVLSDVTNRRRAELALQQAQKMQAVGQLAGGVAHEFNNMLTAIGGFARMAARAPEQGSRVTMCLAEIVKASDRAASLTAQLLNFSRQGAGRAVPIVVGDLVLDLKTFLRPVLGERIGVTMEIADPQVTVQADPAQLTQAIVNLAINGRDAMPEGGEIVIRVAGSTPDRPFAGRHPELAAARYAAISVRDQGCGIPEAIIDRIFEPFFTTKEQGKGTGLGLSMVYTLATGAGGTVEVQSAPGAGSTFTLYLPAVGAAATAEVAAAPAAPEPHRATVLLVEDEDQVRTFLRLTLEEHGLDVLAAADGNEALQLHRRHGTALRLLITDLVMPTLGGIAVAQMLLREQPELPVIYISGYAASGPAGAIGPGQMLLRKPIEPAALLAAVDAALDRCPPSPGPAPGDIRQRS